MTSIQFTSQVNVGLEQLLSGVAQLETAELESFAEQVNFILAKRKGANLPQREIELLAKINRGLPAEIQKRYDFLQSKLRAETITTEEHEELITMIDTVEQAGVDRLQALVELAQLRQISLDALMNQLGIQPPPVYA
jgi:hypothetical protein